MLVLGLFSKMINSVDEYKRKTSFILNESDQNKNIISIKEKIKELDITLGKLYENKRYVDKKILQFSRPIHTTSDSLFRY